jgi:hypothetical protein
VSHIVSIFPTKDCGIETPFSEDGFSGGNETIKCLEKDPLVFYHGHVVFNLDTSGYSASQVESVDLVGYVTAASGTTGDHLQIADAANEGEAAGWSELGCNWKYYDTPLEWGTVGGSWNQYIGWNLGLPDHGYTGEIRWELDPSFVDESGGTHPCVALMYNSGQIGTITFASLQHPTEAALHLEMVVKDEWKHHPPREGMGHELAGIR